MKKNNILLTSVTAIIAAIGVANADIEKNAESADCDNATLGVESGPTNLEAQWEANKITLTWYDGDTQLELESEDPATECTYDGALTVPSDTLTRTGYTFDGWTVRPRCWPSNIDTSTNGITTGYSPLDGTEGYNESTYGLTVGSGEWATEFSYGIVKGMAKCSAKSGNNNNYTWNNASSNWTASESELTSATGEAQYCWCQITGYTPKTWIYDTGDASSAPIYLTGYTNKTDCKSAISSITGLSSTSVKTLLNNASSENPQLITNATGANVAYLTDFGCITSGGASGHYDVGSACSVSASSWVFLYHYGSASSCAAECAGNCAGNVRSFSDVRSAVFGVVQ